MFDLHYDLLTYIYMKQNDIDFIKNHCKKIYNTENITGGIFNLFFMTPKEMKEELHINSEELDITKMLQTVQKLIKQYNIIPQNIQYKVGIEGLDYLKDLNEIDVLYDLGVRSVNIVWNNKNKFGGGIRAKKEEGLTKQGEELVYKLIEKKIAIDLSHANETTFFDIINICKKAKLSGNNPIVIASHSNCKSICNVPRNLTDEQILEIKNLNGIIGVVSYKKFCIDVSEDIIKKDDKSINYKAEYIKHINYLKKLLGGIDSIGISTDDMGYYEYINSEYYRKSNIFQLENIKEQVRDLLLKNNYTEKEIDKILSLNANRILK